VTVFGRQTRKHMRKRIRVVPQRARQSYLLKLPSSGRGEQGILRRTSRGKEELCGFLLCSMGARGEIRSPVVSAKLACGTDFEQG